MPAKAATLADALLAVQQAAPKLQKDSINPHFRNKYISLDALMPQILPVLNSNGIVLTQFPTHGPDDAPALLTRLTHAPTGEVIESTMPLMLDKQTAQGLGSAITYARRYSLLSILGLVADVDDDGADAEKDAPRARMTPRRPAEARRALAPAQVSGDADW